MSAALVMSRVDDLHRPTPHHHQPHKPVFPPATPEPAARAGDRWASTGVAAEQATTPPGAPPGSAGPGSGSGGHVGDGPAQRPAHGSGQPADAAPGARPGEGPAEPGVSGAPPCAGHVRSRGEAWEPVRSSHGTDREDVGEWALRCVEAVALPAATRRKMTDLCVALDRIVKAECGRDARVDAFGSSVCGFATVHSDLDLTVALLGSTLDAAAKKQLLKRLSKTFRFRHGMNSFAVLGARIPVIKLKDPSTGLSADVSVQNDMPVFKSNLLLQYSKIDSRFRQLVLIIKTWSTARNINNASHGTLNSFGYTMLALYYLQRVSPPILPCLQQESVALRGEALSRARTEGREECVQRPRHPQGRVNGVDIHFVLGDRLAGWGAENESTLGELLKGFFRFYAEEFDLRREVLCVRDPACPPRDEMEAAPNQEVHFWMRDPLDPRENCARSVNVAAGERMMGEFVRAHEVLSAGRPSALCEKASPGGGKKKQARTQAAAGATPQREVGEGGGEGGA